jgi:hypothetical protein
MVDIIHIIELLTHHTMGIRNGGHSIVLRICAMQARQRATLRVRSLLLRSGSRWHLRLLNRLLEVCVSWRVER